MKKPDDPEHASRLFVLAALKRQSGERKQADAFARRGKECPIQRPMLDRW